MYRLSHPLSALVAIIGSAGCRDTRRSSTIHNNSHRVYESRHVQEKITPQVQNVTRVSLGHAAPPYIHGY